MRYLVDTSALVRLQRRQVDPSWTEFVGRGLLCVCEPVVAETLLIADAKAYAKTEQTLVDTYVPVTVPDGVWNLVAVLRRELAAGSAHQGLSVADLVVAATAILLKLTVLHEDGDFETMSRFVPQLQERRISLSPA